MAEALGRVLSERLPGESGSGRTRAYARDLIGELGDLRALAIRKHCTEHRAFPAIADDNGWISPKEKEAPLLGPPSEVLGLAGLLALVVRIETHTCLRFRGHRDVVR
jgi:hypothetical protein